AKLRRHVLFLEHAIADATQWAVFEPNGAATWKRLRDELSGLLECSRRDGRLRGSKPEQAFFVRCDRTTMTQDDLDDGRLVALVGVALVRPAEFTIVRIQVATAPPCRPRR